MTAIALGRPVTLPREEVLKHITKDDEMHSREYRQDELRPGCESDAEMGIESDDDFELVQRRKSNDG